MKEPERRFIGIDLGKRPMTIHAISVGEKHSSWTCMTDVEGRIRLLKRLTAFDIIVMEACPLAFILKSIIKNKSGLRYMSSIRMA